MGIIDRLFNNEQEEPKMETRVEKKRYVGRIFMLSKGWGFISCNELPYERIFFHWSGLNANTLRFPQLEKGMEVEFETMDIPDKGFRAIKIQVLED